MKRAPVVTVGLSRPCGAGRAAAVGDVCGGRCFAPSRRFRGDELDDSGRARALTRFAP